MYGLEFSTPRAWESFRPLSCDYIRCKSAPLRIFHTQSSALKDSGPLLRGVNGRVMEPAPTDNCRRQLYPSPSKSVFGGVTWIT